MAAYSCNGTCHRHPRYSKKRLIGKKFRDNIDAICRKCEAYFKNLPDRFCPCCSQRVGRHTRRTKAFIRNQMFTAFADFWRWILRETKQYKKYESLDIMKPKRKCLLCGSNKTCSNKKRYDMWVKFNHGFICTTCYNREKYRQGKGKRDGMVITVPNAV